MKTVLKLIGLFAFTICLIGLLVSAFSGYHENISAIWGYSSVAVVAFILCVFADNIGLEEFDNYRTDDAMRQAHRDYLINKMNHWSTELEADELIELRNSSGEQ